MISLLLSGPVIYLAIGCHQHVNATISLYGCLAMLIAVVHRCHRYVGLLVASFPQLLIYYFLVLWKLEHKMKAFMFDITQVIQVLHPMYVMSSATGASLQPVRHNQGQQQ